MKRIILMLMLAAMLVVALTVAAPSAFATKYDNPASKKDGPSDSTGGTDPPGTCTLQQGQGGGNGNNDSHHGSCNSNGS